MGVSSRPQNVLEAHEAHLTSTFNSNIISHRSWQTSIKRNAVRHVLVLTAVNAGMRVSFHQDMTPHRNRPSLNEPTVWQGARWTKVPRAPCQTSAGLSSEWRSVSCTELVVGVTGQSYIALEHLVWYWSALYFNGVLLLYCSILYWCLFFVGCLTSQQQASVAQGRICSDNFYVLQH